MRDRCHCWAWRRALATCILGLFCHFVSAEDLPFTLAWEGVHNRPGPIKTTVNLPDGRLWVIDRNDNCRIFDPSTATFHNVAKPPFTAETFCLCTDGRLGTVRYFKPWDPAKRTIVAYYDFEANSWQTIAKQSPPLYGAEGVFAAPNGGIWVSTGRGKNWIYNPTANSWTQTLALGAYARIGGQIGLQLPNGMSIKGKSFYDTVSAKPAYWNYAPLIPDHISMQKPPSLIGTTTYFCYSMEHGEIREMYKAHVYEGQDRVILSTHAGDPLSPIHTCALRSNRGTYIGCFKAHVPRGRISSRNMTGQVRLDVYDSQNQTWTNNQIRYPVTFDSVSSSSFQCRDTKQGVLVWCTQPNLSMRFLRITNTGPGIPDVARVSTELPTTLSLKEGRSAFVPFRLEGEIPDGGVTVVAERVTGDGDIRVLDGVSQTCEYTFQQYHISIASLIDADDRDDRATIRLRVVQADGGADPNAREISVTVEDIYRNDPSHLPGDVNGDGVVNALDLDEVIDHFGTTANSQ